MYTALLITAIGSCVVLYFAVDNKLEAILAAIVFIFGTLISALIGTIAGGMLSMLMPYHNAVYQNGELVAMRNTQGLDGMYVIGTFGLSGRGELHNAQQYNFLLRVDDGSMVPHTIVVDTLVHIVEDESLKDVGIWSTTYYEPDTRSALTNWALYDADDRTVVRQEFRVPVGTVVQNFEIR